jgi:hypothetical protein
MTITSDALLRSELIGTWTLVALTVIRPDGAVSLPLGPRPAGQLVYDVNGRMSAQLVRGDQAKFESDDNVQALPEEAAAAWRGYIGYFGTFDVDAQAPAVTHHVEGAWFPNLVGVDQVRTCRLEGDQLALEGITPYGRTLISWERVKPPTG